MSKRSKLLTFSLALMAATWVLAACEKDSGRAPQALTNARVSRDLVEKTVADSAVGEFRLGRETYAEIREQRASGGKTVVRAALRAIDAKARTGIEGDVELTYAADGAIDTLRGTSLRRMDGKYAERLAELVPFPLHFAANIGDLGKVEEELQKGTAVDLPEEKKGSTALMFAAERGFPEIVKRLAAKGGNVNHRNKYGFSALHAAAAGNRLEVAKFLLEKGAQVDVQDELGQTPLYFAAERGHLDLVRLLVEKGADVNKPAKKGWPPLYAAAAGNFLDVAKFLLEHGATVNTKTGATTHSPLLIAAHNKNVEMVRLLLAAGADRSARLSSHHSGYQNQTALDIARRQGSREIVELLEQTPTR